jgi:hypothetical protein
MIAATVGSSVLANDRVTANAPPRVVDQDVGCMTAKRVLGVGDRLKVIWPHAPGVPAKMV